MARRASRFTHRGIGGGPGWISGTVSSLIKTICLSPKHTVSLLDKTYHRAVPKLWTDTVAEHRRDVNAAILDAAWQLASERGVRGVTMGRVAELAGIGRATLYKYFSGVEEILVAAHEAHVDAHLVSLSTLSSRPGTPGEALARVLGGYARISFHRGKSAAPDLQALVHSGQDNVSNTDKLRELFTTVITDAQASGEVRRDVAAAELAAYCVHALAAAGDLSAEAALDGLVRVVEAGLRPQSV